MTFLMVLMNVDQAIQVSDRRLMRDGIPVADEANKAFVYDCQDARMIVGICGLAEVGPFRTTEWLARVLPLESAPDYLSRPSLERLAGRASSDFNTVPALKGLGPGPRRLTMFFNGYSYAFDPPLGVTAMVSNWQHFGGEHPVMDRPVGDFAMTYLTEVQPRDEKMTMIQILGARAMLRSEEPPLRRMLLARRQAPEIVAKAIATVRKVARRPRAGGSVGTQLTSIVLPRDRTSSPQVDYHSTISTNIDQLPGLIVARDDGFRGGFESISINLTGTGAMIMPKVGRNAPCPCGSGIKYKRCHGAPTWYAS